VQIFEMGDLEGRPFYAMEYVAGGSLAARTRGTPQPPAEVALLVERVARAMHAVHEQGVVHRDLKPANVLLTDDDAPLGQAAPKIVDFGLAKFIDLDSPLTTVSRDVLGTPLYMAPEQAAGQSKDAGPAVDIYALGALLYVLLTGQPPFKGATLLDTLTQIKTSDPVPPHRLVPQVPRDLETICLKCLQKEPRKRYASAEALADDLHRFSSGQPILARPTAWWERGVKWARREPRVAALVAAISAITLIGLVTTLALWRLADHRAEAEAQQRRKVEQLAESEAEQRRQVELLAKAEAQQRRQVEKQLYFSRILLADRELQTGRAAWARQQLELCPPALRGWEWRHLMRQCNDQAAVNVCTGGDGEFLSVAFSPDHKHLATGGRDGAVRLWDAATAAAVRELKGHLGSINGVVFSPQGDQMVSTGQDTQVVLWNTRTWEKELVFERHDSPVSSAAFDPVKNEVASGTFNRFGPSEILIWDRGTGEVRLTLKGHDQRISGLAYRSDGKRLFSSSHDRTVRIWDTDTGEIVRVFDRHALPVAGLAVSRDGRLVVSAAGRRQADAPGESDIKIWEADTGRIVHHLQGHRERPLTMAFSPDGDRLATAGWDAEIKLWDVSSGQEVLTLRGHASGDAQGIMGLSFSPCGDLLASAGVDGTARIWSGAEAKTAGTSAGKEEGATTRP
jgi:sugar lactone lactonase YvrE